MYLQVMNIQYTIYTYDRFTLKFFQLKGMRNILDPSMTK